MALLHVLHYVFPRPGEHLLGFARQIDLRHGEIHLRYFGRLVLAREHPASCRRIARLEALLLSVQLVFEVKHAVALNIQYRSCMSLSFRQAAYPALAAAR